MKQTSKTGLTASPTKKITYKNPQSSKIQLKTVAKPAPFILKPFSTLFNPYPGGCSLLCNHPVNQETRKLLKKAKEQWATGELRNILLAEEIEAIKTGLNYLNNNENNAIKHLTSHVESVPEELFRRYTETDSRPLTPAPTLASAATKASGSRRCVTPEAGCRNTKARLVLDLRKTHSQETISYSASLYDTPLILIQHVPTRAASLEELPHARTSLSRQNIPVQSPRKTKSSITLPSKTNLNPVKIEKVKNNDDQQNKCEDESVDKIEDEEYTKRRGKKKKKKERDASRGPPGFQASTDPETQVGTIDADSTIQSARTSLIPPQTVQDFIEDFNNTSKPNSGLKPHRSLDVDSYLDAEILRQLRRELNEEIVDNELNLKRRKALEEALKAISKDKHDCEELTKLQKELKLAPLNSDLWISLPRTFSRSSARFELPMDGRSLSKITPIEYVRDHVSISSGRKLLYNCIFNKFKREAELENEHERKLLGQVLQEALNLMMGRPMTLEESTRFRNLIDWKDDDVFDFKSFCGICALCERIMAPSYCSRLPDRKMDPCHEIEIADFEMLTRKINGQNIDKRVIQILHDIKSL